MEELKCIGCGAVIQSTDNQLPGFIPESKLNDNPENVVCRRCFRLKNYNEITPVKITKDDYVNIISEIGDKDCLIVKIIDIFDVEGTLIPQIRRLTNDNDLLIIGNKMDLLPKSLKRNKLIHNLRKMISDNNLKPVDVLLMSAKKNHFIDETLEVILEYAKNRDVYIVGATNVGKSTFINSLIKANTSLKDDLITVSNVNGTTLNLIKIPFENNFIIDTPGLINDNQITHYLTQKSIDIITPKKEIKPRNFQLNSDQTLFMGGLARIDYIKGEKTGFVCYFNNDLYIHRTKTVNSEKVYEDNIYKLLSPPFSDSEEIKLKRHQFKTYSKTKYDIVFPGLGFITVKENTVIDVYYKDNLTPYVRESIL